MGACCGKGSQPKDPDKTPYGPSKKADINRDKKKKQPGGDVVGKVEDASATNKEISPGINSDIIAPGASVQVRELWFVCGLK